MNEIVSFEKKPSFTDLLINITNWLPIKKTVTMIKDWGHDVINRIDNKLTNNSIINLNKENVELKETIKSLKNQLLNLEGQFKLNQENLTKAQKQLEKINPLIKEIIEICNKINIEINEQILWPTIIILGIFIFYKVTKIIIKKYYSHLLNKYKVLKFLFPNKYEKLLKNKYLIKEEYEKLKNNNEKLIGDIKILHEQLKEIKTQKIEELNQKKKELKNLKNKNNNNSLEEEKKLKEHRQLYVKTCYTHINNLLNSNIELIKLYELKKQSLNTYLKNIQIYDQFTKLNTLDEAYPLCNFYINKIEDENEFNRLVEEILISPDLEKMYETFNRYYHPTIEKYLNSEININKNIVIKRTNKLLSEIIFLNNSLNNSLENKQDERILSLLKSIQALHSIEVYDKKFNMYIEDFLTLNKNLQNLHDTYSQKNYTEVKELAKDKEVNFLIKLNGVEHCEQMKIQLTKFTDEIETLTNLQNSIAEEKYEISKNFTPFQGKAYFLNEKISIDMI